MLGNSLGRVQSSPFVRVASTRYLKAPSPDLSFPLAQARQEGLTAALLTPMTAYQRSRVVLSATTRLTALINAFTKPFLIRAVRGPLACPKKLLYYAFTIAALLGAATFACVPISAMLLRWWGWRVVPVADRIVAWPVEPGKAIATVALRNLTADPIRIVGARTSCSCMATTNPFPATLYAYNTTSLTFRMSFPPQAKEGAVIGTARFFIESESRQPHVLFVLGSNAGH